MTTATMTHERTVADFHRAVRAAGLDTFSGGDKRVVEAQTAAGHWSASVDLHGVRSYRAGWGDCASEPFDPGRGRKARALLVLVDEWAEVMQEMAAENMRRIERMNAHTEAQNAEIRARREATR